MRLMRFIATMMCGLLLVRVVLAEDTACPALVEQALKATAQVCSNLGRNQICYGNIKAQAYDRSDGLMTFEKAGDKLAVQDVSKLITFPLNVADKTWGVAMLSLQANLPDTLPGQNVTLVAFGDASLENEVAADAPSAPSIAGTANGKLNVRSGPATTFDLAGTLKKDDPVTAIGRNDKGDWVQVSFEGGTGWVLASLLHFTEDTKSLLPTKGDISYNAPMQAFRFRTTATGLKCTEAPESGLLIQSPQHVSVNFRVNGIDIKIGSTALVRSIANDAVRIVNLDGAVVPATANTGVPLLPGQAVEVGNGNTPGTVGVYTADDVRALPLGLLPDAIAIAPVITDIQPHTVVGDGTVNIFPLHFVDADSSRMIAIRQRLVSATSGNWFSGIVPITEADYTYSDAINGELSYKFSCSGINRNITVVYELILVDSTGQASPPAQYTATCSVP